MCGAKRTTLMQHHWEKRRAAERKRNVTRCTINSCSLGALPLSYASSMLHCRSIDIANSLFAPYSRERREGKEEKREMKAVLLCARDSTFVDGNSFNSASADPSIIVPNLFRFFLSFVLWRLLLYCMGDLQRATNTVRGGYGGKSVRSGCHKKVAAGCSQEIPFICTPRSPNKRSRRPFPGLLPLHRLEAAGSSVVS